MFRPEHGRAIADGYFDEGAAMRLPDRAYLNLYEPGSVRVLLEEAMADGLWPAAGTVEVDGWPLFDAVTPLDPPKDPRSLQQPGRLDSIHVPVVARQRRLRANTRIPIMFAQVTAILSTL